MNIYHDCPLDARDFTDYRSSSDLNNDLIVEHNLKNTSEFNRFIRQQGTQYFTKKKEHLEKLYGCGPYDNTMLDEKYIETCTKEGCELNDDKVNGLGTGRKMNILDKNVVNNNVVNKNKIKGGNDANHSIKKVDTLLKTINSMDTENRKIAIEKIRLALANLDDSNDSNDSNDSDDDIVEDLQYN